MIGKKFFQVLNDYKLTSNELLLKNINLLGWLEIEQLNKAINESSVSIVKASKSISENQFNLLVNRSISNSPNLDKYIKKSLLYSNKLFIYNQLGIILDSASRGYTLEFIRQQLAILIPELIKLKPLIDNDLLFLVKPNDFFQKFQPVIIELNKKDFNNQELSSILRSATIGGVPTNDPHKIYARVGSHYLLMGKMIVDKGANKSKIKFILPQSFIPKPLSLIEEDASTKRVLQEMYYFIINDLNSDLLLCDYLKSNYLTHDEIDWALIHKKIPLTKDDALYPAIMELDLKFLDNVTYEDAMKVRKKFESSFEDFRIKISEIMEDIKELPFTPNFKNEVNEIKHKTIDPEIRKLDRTFKTMFISRLIKTSSIAIGTLLATILTNNYATSISGEVLLAHQGAEIKKDILQLRNHPMYFLWKLKNK